MLPGVKASTDISMHDRLQLDYGWTRRQRQVLNLITLGKTNTEIAGALGLSLAGAKWHVAEILSKLQAGSREEAAEYWRHHNGLTPRFGRIFTGMATASLAKWVAVSAGVSLVSAVGLVTLLQLNSEDASDGGSGLPSATSLSSTAAPGTKGLLGVFEDPRPMAPSRAVTAGSAPASPFAAWDGKSTVIYDVSTGKETNLGAGSLPVFSPGGTWAVWIAGAQADGRLEGEVRAIELATGTVKSLGPGRAGFPRFLDNSTVVFSLPGTDSRLAAVDLESGARVDISNEDANRRHRERLSQERMTTPDGFRISSLPNSAATPVARGGPFWRDVTVTDLRSGTIVLAFEAFAALPAGAGQIVVASKPNGATVNIFLVSIAAGQAQFLGTTRLSEPNFPLAADGQRVVWVDDFCGQPQGNVFMYERSSGELIQISGLQGLVTLTPSGKLAVGYFGATAVIDPLTFSTLATVPDEGDVNWSSDYRYAAHGQVGGHGGLC
jgi:DNA-binding CsgD family transcriptional regulator